MNQPVSSLILPPAYVPWPDVDPGIMPLGYRLVVQLIQPRRTTRGGIIKPDESKDAEVYNTQVAKVVAIGPVAFKNRSTGEAWREGDWVKRGDFVRVPKYGIDRVAKRLPNGDVVTFAILDDLHLVALLTEPPEDVDTFVSGA